MSIKCIPLIRTFIAISLATAAPLPWHLRIRRTTQRFAPSQCEKALHRRQVAKKATEWGLDPVVAAGALFSHAEAMTTPAENVHLGL
jgi:hypothetical protein